MKDTDGSIRICRYMYASLIYKKAIIKQ